MIGKLEYEAYFLAVAQVVADVCAMGISVAAWGSGAGSMVNHALFVATANPLDHDLLFERFLSVRRRSLPDIDVDVESARRLEVYDRIIERFGTARVAVTGMPETYRARHALRDTGLALGIAPQVVDRIAKSFPHIRACDIRSALAELPELKQLAAEAGSFGPLWELAEGLDALPRGIAMHLGDVQPLRPGHHSWRGKLSHCNHGWGLPKSFRVIGSLRPLVTEPSYSYGSAWGRGEQLARQRHWDSGDREHRNAPYALTCTADELAAEHTPGVVRAGVKHLTVRGITRLGCARLVGAFPGLTRLSLSGHLGTLISAAALNQLPRLQALTISELFGMDASDCLLPCHVPEIEEVSLHGVPAEYAAVMRKTWRPHVRHGVELDVRGARKPEGVAANAANPLRDWNGREHIPRTGYRKAVAQYKATRDALLTEVTGGEDHGNIAEIGRAFGAAFNALDSRTRFIETRGERGTLERSGLLGGRSTDSCGA